MDGNFFSFLMVFFLIVSGCVALVSGALFLFWGIWYFREAIDTSLNMDVEVVKVALGGRQKANGEEKLSGREAEWKEEVGSMEQLLTSFSSMRRSGTIFKKANFDFALEIANPSDSEEIFFFIAFPRRYREAVEKQIHSFFPDSVVEPSGDYTIFSPNSSTAVSTLKLKDSHAFPILTYEDMDVDPFNEISNALSKLETKQEGAAFQIVFHTASDSWRSEGREIAHKMQQGKRLKDVHQPFLSKLLSGFGGILSDMIRSTVSKEGDVRKPDEKIVQLTPEEQEFVKAMERKTSKSAYKVNIRLLASAMKQERADQILSHLENAFGQFARSDINYFQVKSRSDKRDVAFEYIMRTFDARDAVTLGVEEISSMFHFPISTTQTPKIKWVKSGASAPPPNIPSDGLLLGYNDYRGAKTDVRLALGDRRRHLYVIGQTGVGKSNFLQEMAKQDVKSGNGMCFIDPHGDAIDDILTAVPKERAEDVVYFNPADMERPIGLNMMEFDASRPQEKTFVINEMINIFDKLYDLKQTGGPMFEQYMRNAMLLVMEDVESGSTLMEIPRVLSDEEFRRYKLSKCKNPIVKDFWTKEAEKAGGEASLANMVPYITSKLTQFITNDMMRPIIAQQKSAINFRDIMDSKKILLINLSKGRIGEMNSYLLGMVIVGKLLMSALSRADMPEKDRKDFYLYIDEFQNVTTNSISQILSEARKYRLSLTIAHQFIGQLSEEISKAVFGNVGSVAAFRVGPEDAEFLEKQFSPVFSANDLVNVDNYNCFARLLINNETTKPFNMKTYPPTEGNQERVPLLKELSRLKYGRDAEIVNREIEERVNLRLRSSASSDDLFLAR